MQFEGNKLYLVKKIMQNQIWFPTSTELHLDTKVPTIQIKMNMDGCTTHVLNILDEAFLIYQTTCMLTMFFSMKN